MMHGWPPVAMTIPCLFTLPVSYTAGAVSLMHQHSFLARSLRWWL